MICCIATKINISYVIYQSVWLSYNSGVYDAPLSRIDTNDDFTTHWPHVHVYHLPHRD